MRDDGRDRFRAVGHVLYEALVRMPHNEPTCSREAESLASQLAAVMAEPVAAR